MALLSRLRLYQIRNTYQKLASANQNIVLRIDIKVVYKLGIYLGLRCKKYNYKQKTEYYFTVCTYVTRTSRNPEVSLPTGIKARNT